MPPNLVSTGFSLASIVTWGSADFLGGYAAQRADAFLVTALAHGSGLVFVTAVALLQHAPFPNHVSVLWALAGGLSGGISLAVFYRALSSGQMGLNAPVAAVLGASIPVAVGFALEGLPHALQIAGFLLAGLGIWFICKPDHLTGPPEGMGLAILAGFGFAGFFLFMRQTGNSSAVWVASISKIASLTLVGIIVAVKAMSGRLQRGRTGIAVLAGVLDVMGTVFYVCASQTGRLDVSVVLCSLYPMVTVLLAGIFLKERFTTLRLTGMAAALLAMPLITLK